MHPKCEANVHTLSQRHWRERGATGIALLKPLDDTSSFFRGNCSLIRQLPTGRINILPPAPPYGHRNAFLGQVCRKCIQPIFV